MDLPLEALKLVSQEAPAQEGTNHNLIWTPENGFVLFISAGGQFQPIRFDYGDTINEIKEEITALTGVPMPEKQKKEKGTSMDKKASKTPLLDSIKEAVLGNTNIRDSIETRNRAINAATSGGTSVSPARQRKFVSSLFGSNGGRKKRGPVPTQNQSLYRRLTKQGR